MTFPTTISPLGGAPDGRRQSGELAAHAAAEQARAAIQARYVMALQRPRDIDDARVRLLAECKRRGMAEAAIYRKPIGRSHVEGPSIRLAEVALRCFRNVLVEVAIIHDDEEKRIVRVSCTDLESNLTYPTEKVITKTVERRQLRDGMEKVGERVNTQGQTVYIVRATEDDLLVKEAAIVSKAIRTNGLRLIPGDLLDEAIATCKATLEADAAKDPAAERKRLADAFAALGVAPGMLNDYLGHPLASITPAEIVDLRSVYRSLKDGETSWSALVEARSGGGEDGAPKLTVAEQAERKDLLGRLSRARVGFPAALASALLGSKLEPSVRLEGLDLAVLRTLASAVSEACGIGGEPAPKGGAS